MRINGVVNEFYSLKKDLCWLIEVLVVVGIKRWKDGQGLERGS